MKTYMVVERFKDGCFDAVYQRHAEHGRLLPDGLNYLNSWVNSETEVCFQLMETSHPELFQVWFEKWCDLVDFELFEID